MRARVSLARWPDLPDLAWDAFERASELARRDLAGG